MRVQFLLIVEVEDDLSRGAVDIASDRADVPLAAWIVATEHMMKATALNSSAGFEKALELLCDGARRVATIRHDGRLTQ